MCLFFLFDIRKAAIILEVVGTAERTKGGEKMRFFDYSLTLQENLMNGLLYIGILGAIVGIVWLVDYFIKRTKNNKDKK